MDIFGLFVYFADARRLFSFSLRFLVHFFITFQLLIPGPPFSDPTFIPLP